MTAEMGRRVRHAVRGAAAGSGVHRAVISGLANEYADYFTTPQEYDTQHYEGAATVYGRASGVALQEELVKLTKDLVHGKPAPKPSPFDPRNGVKANAAPFPRGAGSASAVRQPHRRTRRLQHPRFAWRGGVRGFDRPLDRAFVLVQRRGRGGRWHTTESDLGLNILWRVSDSGTYRAEWEPPYRARPGTYRFMVHARRYRLHSKPFRLRASRALTAIRVSASAGRVAVRLDYPAPRVREGVGDPAPDSRASLTDRPHHVGSGAATFLIDGRRKTVAPRPDGRFVVAASPGAHVEILRGQARDRFGNRNRKGLRFTA